MKTLSIGVFDSGIGGLTVLKEIKKLLPNEHYAYLGDTARVPYGNRSPDVVRRYSFENALFLLTQGIKLLVIACNTSSAVSLNFLKKKLPISVVGVIESACREAVVHTKNGRIGVIGTKRTIASGAYEETIKCIDRHVKIFSQACPLFVPIVEEGLADDPVAFYMAEKYLKEIKENSIDVLILGCTHYPVMEHAIRKTIGDNVYIVNTGKETARDVKKILEEEGLLNKIDRGGTNFFVTDDPENFKSIGSLFLGEPIRTVRHVRSLFS